MIAYLGMYDRPETAAANDQFWAAIRTGLMGTYDDLPEALDRKTDAWSAWGAKDLVLGQTCGCPLRTRLYGEVQLVGTPDYGHQGCPPGHYYSVFVARKGSDVGLHGFDGKAFAYNDSLSQSGWAGPLIHMQDAGLLPGRLVESGSHRESAQAVAEGSADFASIDILSWEMIQKYDAFAADLDVIDRTASTPGLPFITALGNDPAPLFAAIETAIATLDADAAETLHLKGLVAIPMSDYLAVSTPPGPILTEQRIRGRANA
ncbi:phosphate/phosphite/phosphonate ABC transporter substrate-binding protein [Phycobacter azelaicus]|uniref:phosphate/phosphite/phosphonate ABC transporter substrate-binding protein n=1 Tax=Phycobacter azelaicus TaxID=2668075 RepID=UPI001867E885|nr:PhnD/SsuA/transferrin family substrate-binding protein [Phycobacter azelaicus]